MRNGSLLTVTPDYPSFKFRFRARRVEIFQIVMQNVVLAELLGPAIMQAKGYLNLSLSYMTAIYFTLPSRLFIPQDSST